MDFKNVVDTCGEESRSSNPILSALDIFTKDKHGVRDQYGGRHRHPRGHGNQMISPHDFEQFQEDELSKEFSKMRFQPQRNGSQFPHQYGQMEFMRAQQNQMYRRDNSQWANEFHKSMQDNREFEDFERVYNSKSRQPQHRPRFENQPRWEDEFMDDKWMRESDEIFEKGSRSMADEFLNDNERFDTEKWVTDFEALDKNRQEIFERIQNGESDWVEDFIQDDTDDEDAMDPEEYLRQNARPHEYLFEENNPFMGDPEAFEKGIALFKEGNLSEAILAFESVVQKDPGHANAWHHLGLVQAENDKDYQSSLALEKAVEADPENRDTLVALAVTYTNNAQRLEALQTLMKWVLLSPQYAHLAPQKTLTGVLQRDHNMVIDIFIKAARITPNDPDPDVQISLGLLFNLEFKFEKGADCFKAALLKRPYDYSLWNKLGATLANHRKFEDAVDAYYHALNIKPSYTRARSNLGISFMSLKEYGESAKGFLSALAINPNAEHIWDNLKTVFFLMDRQDLVDKCKFRDPVAFEDEFNF